MLHASAPSKRVRAGIHQVISPCFARACYDWREMSKWLEDSVKRERERCAEIDEFKTAGGPFINGLFGQLHAAIIDFQKEFPDWKIKVDGGPFYLRATATDWVDPTPSVNVRLNLMKRCLLIEFSDRTELNTEMPMEIINGLEIGRYKRTYRALPGANGIFRREIANPAVRVDVYTGQLCTSGRPSGSYPNLTLPRTRFLDMQPDSAKAAVP
jgi:hypothetical protein